jgi:hypothetical protein
MHNPDREKLTKFMERLGFIYEADRDVYLRDGNETRPGMNLSLWENTPDNECFFINAPNGAVLYGELEIGLGASGNPLGDGRDNLIAEIRQIYNGRVPEIEYAKILDPIHFEHYKTALALRDYFKARVIVDGDNQRKIKPNRDVLPQKRR